MLISFFKHFATQEGKLYRERHYLGADRVTRCIPQAPHLKPSIDNFTIAIIDDYGGLEILQIDQVRIVARRKLACSGFIDVACSDNYLLALHRNGTVWRYAEGEGFAPLTDIKEALSIAVESYHFVVGLVNGIVYDKKVKKGMGRG